MRTKPGCASALPAKPRMMIWSNGLLKSTPFSLIGEAMDQYNYDYDWDSSYCYPNSFTLINNLGIKDAPALNTAEREITAMRVSQIMEHICKGNFDLKHLQAIHNFLFHDVYSWAGKLRTVNIAKGNQFCNWNYIISGSKPTFEKLKSEDKFLIGVPLDDICGKLAYFLGEINVIHPFREGNGRSQRVFIQYLARVAGYRVDWTDVSGKEMIEASTEAFNCDYQRMTDLFRRITAPIPVQEQEEFIHSIATKGSPVLEAYDDFSLVQKKIQEESDSMHMTF
jgi:cell filamentation protein